MNALKAVLLFGAISAIGMLAAGDASAGQRQVHVWDRFYPGPDFILRPRNLRYIFGGYIVDPDDPSDGEFDEGYYEPEVNESQPAKKATNKKATETVTVKQKPKTEVKTASVPTDAQTKTDTSAKKKTGKGPLTCDKAGEVIGGFGFSSVKPEDCKGQVYAFNATRSGKTFAIKINAASGELTEVKKLQ